MVVCVCVCETGARQSAAIVRTIARNGATCRAFGIAGVSATDHFG
jgi:hypothetical protein